MNTISNDEFAARVMLLAQSAERFTPRADYDEDGDCIEFLTRPDPFYAERIDDLVTVYYSQITDEVIGSFIKGVSVFCEVLKDKLPGFLISIQDGRIQLQHLFLARMWMQESPKVGIAAVTYKKLAQIAEESSVDAQVCKA
jgi:hypothetical protein